MAYMNQERKKKLAAELKKQMSGYGLKYSLRVDHYSSIVMTISEGPLDFIKNAQEVRDAKPCPEHFRYQKPSNYIHVNTYWINEHFSGAAAVILSAAKAALSIGNHDNSDAQSDYFDVGWYVNINIGQWNKPYKVTR